MLIEKASTAGTTIPGGGSLKISFKAMQMLPKNIGIMARNVALISTPLALILSADPAKAILNITILDDGPNLKVEVSGSLSQLGSSSQDFDCYFIEGNGALITNASGDLDILYTGNNIPSPLYTISGPSGFGGTAGVDAANSVSGSSFVFLYSTTTTGGFLSIDSSYVVGQPFLSSATLNNTSTAAQGFTVPGLISTWTINGTSESINLFVGSPPTPSSAVPGPLPLFGAGAAFVWTRRLRRRIASPLITPHK